MVDSRQQSRHLRIQFEPFPEFGISRTAIATIHSVCTNARTATTRPRCGECVRIARDQQVSAGPRRPTRKRRRHIGTFTFYEPLFFKSTSHRLSAPQTSQSTIAEIPLGHPGLACGPTRDDGRRHDRQWEQRAICDWWNGRTFAVPFDHYNHDDTTTDGGGGRCSTLVADSSSRKSVGTNRLLGYTSQFVPSPKLCYFTVLDLFWIANFWVCGRRRLSSRAGGISRQTKRRTNFKLSECKLTSELAMICFRH